MLGLTSRKSRPRGGRDLSTSARGVWLCIVVTRPRPKLSSVVTLDRPLESSNLGCPRKVRGDRGVGGSHAGRQLTIEVSPASPRIRLRTAGARAKVTDNEPRSSSGSDLVEDDDNVAVSASSRLLLVQRARDRKGECDRSTRDRIARLCGAYLHRACYSPSRVRHGTRFSLNPFAHSTSVNPRLPHAFQKNILLVWIATDFTARF